MDSFGKELLAADKTVDVASAFEDVELIGIYFSAHWCPPCRGFTPTLADFYKAVNGGGKKRLEIVFVSHDRDEASFKSYFASMPWLAVPFSESDIKEQLISENKVSGIPKLVFLNKDGSVKFEDGRSKVAGDPLGAKFPW